MMDLTPAWMLDCGPTIDSNVSPMVFVNGVKVNVNFLSPDALKALKVSGDIQCGLLYVRISVPRLNVIG